MTVEGPRLLLHIGAMKTGTTYLQTRLTANAEALAGQGWWVPEGPRIARAVRELLPAAGGGPTPKWDELMREARAWDGHGTVISMEFLSFARRQHVPGILERMAGVDLHVVLAVRDAVRALPSQWQTLTRNGFGFSWPEFAGGVRQRRESGPGPGTAPFRRTQDVHRMLVAWGNALPRERLKVITVPAPSQPRDLLWERFLGMIDVDPQKARAPARFDNPQLGYGTCELLRLVNRAGLDGEDPVAYRKIVRRLTHDHVDALREGQSRPRMDAATAEFAVAFNARTRRMIRNRGTLVGERSDLPTSLENHPVLDELDSGPLPEAAPEAEVHRAAEVMRRASLEMCARKRLALPDALTGPLPGHLTGAVEQVAGLMAVAMTGDVSHRPTPRPPRVDASTVATGE